MDQNAARSAFAAALRSSPDREDDHFFLAGFFGFMSVPSDEGDALEFEVCDFLHNPHGTLHGGVMALALGNAMGAALRREGVGPAATVQMTINYLRPVSGGRVRCEARLLKGGEAVSQVEAHLADAHGQVLARASATWARL